MLFDKAHNREDDLCNKFYKTKLQVQFPVSSYTIKHLLEIRISLIILQMTSLCKWILNYKAIELCIEHQTGRHKSYCK